MASRPSKRQKRPIVLSSDDEGNSIPSAVQPQSSRVNGISLEWNHKPTNASNTSKHILPTRQRAKTRSTTLKSHPPPTSELTNPTSSLKHETQTRVQITKAGDTKSLYTFFNNTDLTSHFGDKPQHEAQSPEAKIEEDLIEDDSLDEELRRLPDSQTATIFALDRRKRHLAPTQSRAISTHSETVPSASQKFIIPKNKDSQRQRPKKVLAAMNKADLRPWAERYGPRDIEELAVHKKKVADVQGWLDRFMQGQDQKILLVLKGPSGAGKTTTISALAGAMRLDISEWKNPVDSSYNSEGFVSMSAQFEDFLGRSGKFSSLAFTSSDSSGNPVSTAFESHNGSSGNRIVLLEEFPNTFTSTSTALKSFRSSILNYLAANTPSVGTLRSRPDHLPDNLAPLVMIITETHLTQTSSSHDSLSAHRLLGPEILNHPGVSVIEFNPIAPTFLLKALDLVIQKEARQSGRRRIPGPTALTKLSEFGDVRSAISALEFLCLRGKDGDDWGGTVATRTKKGLNALSALTKMEKEILEMVTQREASLGIFHAVGKVVYNKRDQVPVTDSTAKPPVQPPDHLPQHARLKPSQVCVDELGNETGTDTRTFVATLHENYVMSCEGASFTDCLNGCIEALSDSDLLCSGRRVRFGTGGLGGGFGGATYQGAASDLLREDEICFHVAVRGLLFALPYPVKRRAPPAGMAGRTGGKGDAFKMFYPASLRLLRQMEEVEILVDQWASRYGAGVARSRQATEEHEYASGGVAAWSRQSSVFNTSASGSTQDAIQLHQAGMSATKNELILETLPYIAKLERCRPGEVDRLNELDKMTQFHGIHAPSDQASEENDDDGISLSMSMNRSGPNPSPKDQRRADLISSVFTLPAEIGLGKLYLSDDDIEDDEP